MKLEFLVILKYYLDKEDLTKYIVQIFISLKTKFSFIILSLFYLNNIQESRETLNSDRNPED